ncbi:MAG: phospho-N-acetylmuramoyl-pentapeptide-transferase [Chlamydiae bacterium]|nr:phospho-N-acetylmuramoyl-pentapeptide-transferase [Chlamydiota bacterium]
MILLVLHFLERIGLKIPTLFFYASTRMIFAAIFALVATICLGRPFIRKLYELKVGHTVRVSDVKILSEQYQKNRNVPSMGGLIFLTTLFFSGVLWMDFSQAFTWILFLTMVWMGFIGFLDDRAKLKNKRSLGLSGRKKFLLQVFFSLLLSLYLFSPLVTDSLKIVAPPFAKEKLVGGEVLKLPTKEYASRYYIPFFKKPVVVTGFWILIAICVTIFVITGSTNAVNLTDGLDGLATGLALFVASVLAIISFLSNNLTISSYLNIIYIEGSGEIAIFLCSLIGALLGFLWFNGYPAEVFMGDTGSLALGGILGVSAVLLRREFLYAIIGGVFVLETLSVIIQVVSFKFRNGKRVFLCAPIHHHFQMKGWHETKVVIRFWMIGLLLALIGLATLKIQ